MGSPQRRAVRAPGRDVAVSQASEKIDAPALAMFLGSARAWRRIGVRTDLFLKI